MVDEAKLVEEWEDMLDFSDNLIQDAQLHVDKGKFANERIAIVLFDQATELLMKSWILKKGYSINIIDNKKTKVAFKGSSKIENFLNKDKTIDFLASLDIIDQLITVDNKSEIKKFHELRNEIYHRSTGIKVEKGEVIKKFVPVLESFYKYLFQDRTFPIRSAPNNLQSRTSSYSPQEHP